jgi:hypothetical protein
VPGPAGHAAGRSVVLPILCAGGCCVLGVLRAWVLCVWCLESTESRWTLHLSICTMTTGCNQSPSSHPCRVGGCQ